MKGLAPRGTERDVVHLEASQAGRGPSRLNAVVAAIAATAAISLLFVAWIFTSRFNRLSSELDQTRLALAAANQEVEQMRAELGRASVVHELWGLGSRFAAQAAGACSAEDDKRRVRAETEGVLEMWSDSTVRTEVDLERTLLPVLRSLESEGVRVIGTSLPAGVVVQYRRFRREALGDTLMLDASRITDSAARSAVFDLLRRVSEGGFDPEQTSILYRFDDYGKVSYGLVQGPADASMLQTDAAAGRPPLTVSASEPPCS